MIIIQDYCGWISGNKSCIFKNYTWFIYKDWSVQTFIHIFSVHENPSSLRSASDNEAISQSLSAISKTVRAGGTGFSRWLLAAGKRRAGTKDTKQTMYCCIISNRAGQGGSPTFLIYSVMPCKYHLLPHWLSCLGGIPCTPPLGCQSRPVCHLCSGAGGSPTAPWSPWEHKQSWQNTHEVIVSVKVWICVM